MQLSPGLRRIGSDIVPSYLVADQQGVTIVDAGLSGHWSELATELEEMGRVWDDIKGLVLTHGDTDHVGFAERLRREHEIPIYIHEADAAQARGESPKKNPPWGRFKVGPLLGFLWYAGRRGGMKTESVGDVVPVSDGQTLDLPGNPRVIHLPGHSPGSVAYHFPAVSALFVGDALTTRHVLTGEEGPQPAPFTLEPEQAMESLRRLEDVDADWLLPGHGPPWTGGVAEAVRRTREFAG
jgi:glyoxylase-like metal-dependent hydrolase (beta-lactamase superfamily II)